ncbi:MAG: sodium:proton antiporter [Bacteroidetes bacterium RIFOXYB2_FULL_39_7]|nr:MAG: sodium:proton antiporter [Bacteroidetes bacterium RIFOXYB2_FULL_39_7]
MKKVLSFSLFLIIGLVLSQILPDVMGDTFHSFKEVANILLYVTLAYIMINVGREFELDKTRWKSYVDDYFIAMATAALPWIFVACYYVFILLPVEHNTSWETWKESLLLSRFAAPTSAGILFAMLAAIGLSTSWVYKKIQILAIFDDLDTILLMIPLQIIMIGMRWQMIAVVLSVVFMIYLGWRYLGRFNIRQNWQYILLYSIIVVTVTHSIYFITYTLFVDDEGIHIEVLLPAFVLGMLMRHVHIDNKSERAVTTGISLIFMLLVGMSMPHFLGSSLLTDAAIDSGSVLGNQPMLPAGTIALHVLFVTLLSNLGKLVPLLFYRDRLIEERLAISVGMFTRGEVGAGIIFIALGYNIGGPALVISVLTLVLNLILTGIFVVWVKKLAIRAALKSDKPLTI